MPQQVRTAFQLPISTFSPAPVSRTRAPFPRPVSFGGGGQHVASQTDRLEFSTAAKPALQGLPTPPPALQAYNQVVMDALLRTEGKKKKFHTLTEAYPLLPEPIRHIIDESLEQVTPAQVQNLSRKGHLDMMEEVPDLFFELIGAMLANQIQKPEALKKAAVTLFNADVQNQKQPFSQFRDTAASQLLSQKQIEDLKKVVLQGDQKNGTAWDEKTASELVDLVAAKFIIQKATTPQLDTKKDTKGFLMSEAWEVVEHLGNNRLRQLQVLGLSFLYTHLPFLPPQWFFSQMMGVARQVMKLPVTYSDFMDCVYTKQWLRQNFEYKHFKRYYSNEYRKPITKGPELLMRAAIALTIHKNQTTKGVSN